MTGVKVNTFKKHLDRWMLQIPDLPKCKGYQGYTAANSNAIMTKLWSKGESAIASHLPMEDIGSKS